MTPNKRWWLAACAQVIVYFALVVVVHELTGPRHGLLASFGLTNWTARMADAFIYLISILFIIAIVCRVLNRSSLAALGLAPRTRSTITAGLLLGASLMTFIFV